MVTVPFFCPDTPPLTKNPVFLFSSDRFQKPYPFAADIAVSLDDVLEQKILAVSKLESQVFEGVPTAARRSSTACRRPPMRTGRLAWIRERWSQRQASEADTYRQALVRWYGEERGKAVKYAEVFEICEYGRRPASRRDQEAVSVL